MAVYDTGKSFVSGGLQRDQRESPGRSYRSESARRHHQSRTATAWFCVAPRRRHDIMRKLDLLGVVDRSRCSDAAARDRRSFGAGDLSKLGMVVAREQA